MSSETEIFKALKAAGYTPGEITSNTYCYDGPAGPTAMEKRDRQSYPIDEIRWGAYVQAFQWEDESKLSDIFSAAGAAAATAQNVRKANEAYKNWAGRR